MMIKLWAVIGHVNRFRGKMDSFLIECLCILAPVFKKRLEDRSARYLHERRGAGAAMFGWAFVTWYRQIQAAQAELGIRVGPKRRQTFARKVRAGRYRSSFRAARLQKKWRRRNQTLRAATR